MATNGYQRNFEVYVGNLSGSVTEQDLRNTFQEYKVGKILILYSGTKKYAFVELGSESLVIQAVKEMRNHKLKGQFMVVRAGNTKLNASILNGTVGLKFVNGLSDDCPPPLETVYDCPPPLETVFDGPPPLEVANDGPPPLETVCRTVTRPKQRNDSPVTLVVTNFPFGTTEDDLAELFKRYLPLKASVIVNTRLKNQRTYAYVTVPDQILADRAVYDLDDSVFKQRKLTVTYFLERAF